MQSGNNNGNNLDNIESLARSVLLVIQNLYIIISRVTIMFDKMISQQQRGLSSAATNSYNNSSASLSTGFNINNTSNFALQQQVSMHNVLLVIYRANKVYTLF